MPNKCAESNLKHNLKFRTVRLDSEIAVLTNRMFHNYFNYNFSIILYHKQQSETNSLHEIIYLHMHQCMFLMSSLR